MRRNKCGQNLIPHYTVSLFAIKHGQKRKITIIIRLALMLIPFHSHPEKQ
jgi:hypothetical protein